MEGCEGCRIQKAGLTVVRNHSEQCRRRVAKAMEQTEAGQRKIREEQERMQVNEDKPEAEEGAEEEAVEAEQDQEEEKMEEDHAGEATVEEPMGDSDELE
eukprot:7844267-Karenia_brevis.AAC.1